MVTVNILETEEQGKAVRDKTQAELLAEHRSQIIFKQRMNVGLTQSELAEKANVTQKTVSRIERGDTKVRETTLQKVYAVLNITEEDLEVLKQYID